MFSINTRKQKLVVGLGAIAVAWGIYLIGYLLYTPRHYPARIIPVDIYADNAQQTLAFYESVNNAQCVNILNEHINHVDASKSANEKKSPEEFEAPIQYAFAPQCKTAPTQPAEIDKLGKEGYVGLALNIDAQGNIERGEVDKTSGFEELDKAALQQVTQNWVFHPCKKLNKDVACRQTIKFRWKND